mgnify:CR=1 FL=1
MGDSRGNVTQSIQNMAGPKKTGRNSQRFKKQQPGEDEQNVARGVRVAAGVCDGALGRGGHPSGAAAAVGRRAAGRGGRGRGGRRDGGRTGEV